jgi:hypothetical protein
MFQVGTLPHGCGVASYQTEGLSMTVQQQLSLVDIIQPAQESAIQTEQISHLPLWLSDSRNTHHLCVNIRKTGGRRSERARHAANEDRLVSVARPRVGSLLLMNLIFV